MNPIEPTRVISGPSPQKSDSQRRTTADTAAEIQENNNRLHREGEISLNHLRDSYERQYDSQKTHQEGTLELDKEKASNDLRETQKRQSAELNRVRRDGESEISKLKNYYRNQSSALDKKGREQIVTTQLQAQQIEDSERRNHNHLLDHLKGENQSRVEMMTAENDLLFNELKKAKQEKVENLQTEHQASFIKVTEDLRTQLQQVQDNHSHVLGDIKTKSQQKLGDLQEQALLNVSNYQEKLADPFYQPLDLNTKFTETKNEFILTATIPKHEQKNISVSISGDKLTLSGYRQHKQEIELEKGTDQSTASYQSFHKNFPLTWPVESKKVTRQFQGNQLTITIPKKL